jgi:hypothetical protein
MAAAIKSNRSLDTWRFGNGELVIGKLLPITDYPLPFPYLWQKAEGKGQKAEG